jgi:hypothetical protein
MSFSEVALFVGLGAVVGFAGGLFAIGGALIAIPLLTAGFGFTQHDSQGTAMVMALASASVILLIYARKKLLRVRDGLIITACSTALGLASSQMVRYVNDRVLQRGFGAFLIVLAVLVWFGHLGEGDRDSPLSAPVQIGIGSLAGAPTMLYPETPAEKSFNPDHDGNHCRVKPCGARFALWPAAMVADPDPHRALLFTASSPRTPANFTQSDLR